MCNVSEEEAATGNDLVERARARAEKEGAPVVTISAEGFEAQLTEIDDEGERRVPAGRHRRAWSQPGRSDVALPGLQTYFTAGKGGARLTIPAGASAPHAAGVIHTVFESAD